MNVLYVYPGTGSSYILKMESYAACKIKYLKASYSPKKKNHYFAQYEAT